jgi:hypothetical protein
VRGVASHLDKQAQARKKVEAEEQRKAEVFILHPKAPKAKYTVAQPFRLQGESRVCCLLCCVMFRCFPCIVGASSSCIADHALLFGSAMFSVRLHANHQAE